jgi:hypothetical protein
MISKFSRSTIFLARRHFSDVSVKRETTKMNLFTAVNDAMKIALQTDNSAVVFGEVRLREAF